jgi:hypothetical protein
MIAQDALACTGKQFSDLLRQLDPWIRDCVWYVADIKTNNYVPLTATGDLAEQRLSLADLYDICAQVDQFLSGIFLAVPTDCDEPRLNLGIMTEDDLTSDIGDAILEIRAFDTSYFEIYTGILALADKLHCVYGAEVAQPP